MLTMFSFTGAHEKAPHRDCITNFSALSFRGFQVRVPCLLTHDMERRC